MERIKRPETVSNIYCLRIYYIIDLQADELILQIKSDMEPQHIKQKKSIIALLEAGKESSSFASSLSPQETAEVTCRPIKHSLKASVVYDKGSLWNPTENMYYLVYVLDNWLTI